MGGTLTVKVNGQALRWAELERMIPDAERFSPVRFDVARNLPRLQAQMLHAWLRRRGIAAELSSLAVAGHGAPVRPLGKVASRAVLP